MRKQWYRFIHNCVAHPLLFFTNDSKLAVRLHDWSSLKMPYYEKMSRRKWLKENAKHTPYLDKLFALDPDGEDAQAHAFMEKENAEGHMIQGFMDRRAAEKDLECSHEWTCFYDDVGDPQSACRKCGAQL